MRHQSFDAKIIELRQFFDECIQLVKAHTDTTHAGIDLDVNRGSRAAVVSSAIQSLGCRNLVYHWGQVLSDHQPLLSGPKSSQAEYRTAYAGSTKLCSLFR